MGKHRNGPAGREPGDGKPGYKNVDVRHRWVKGGPSPNPEGRRRKPPPSLRDEMFADLVELLRSKVPAATGERLTVHQALLRRLVSGGINDPKLAGKAIGQLLDMMQALQPDAPIDDAGISGGDADLIQDALQRLSRAGGSHHG